MKTNERARRVRRIRVWAGLVAVLLLASAELWMVCRLGYGRGTTTAPRGSDAAGLGDLIAAR